MISGHDVPPPEGRELRACGLAALGEAGVILLPLVLVLSESRAIDVSIGVLAIPFALAYVGGALLTCRFRTSRNLAAGAAVLGVLAGAWLGRGDLNRSVFAAVVALLVAMRVIALGLRDWRQPIHAGFGWLAVVLGLETMIAVGAEPGWPGPLLVIVPLFFACMLSSRATIVWGSGGADELDGSVRSAWIRRAVLASGGLAVAMIAAVALAVRGGAFERIGTWLAPVANAVVAFVAFVLSQAARPVFWLIDRLGIDPERVREFLENLRANGIAELTNDPGADGTAVWQRALGLLVFAGVAYALYRAIRLLRPEGEALGRPAPIPGTVREAALPVQVPPPPRPRLRREPPADRVRRLYAEALEALRRGGTPKDPALTPAEFEPLVTGAHPKIASEFVRLTRAYEEVRYGSLRLDRPALERLERGQRRLLQDLREAGLSPGDTMPGS
jgi:hypothetical protein